ncbi:MAG: TetR/AcrR family transcriptional regulator [Rhizobiales bacterium]|nr:TetR/AcrR family transcriptional regulator [Hyphomicrobiales bacterium]
MRVSREKAAENRDKIVAAAGSLFRAKGFDGAAVADLMKAAGLTHGGFYGHFESKDALVAEALSRVLAGSIERWNRYGDEDPDGALARIVRRYLSPEMRDNPSGACAVPSLGAEVVRQGPEAKGTFTRGIKGLADALQRLMRRRTTEKRRAEALATLASLVGAVVLARAVDDPAFSDEILSATAGKLLGAAE